MNKIIIHVDMDAFFAAVEVRDNSDLAGRPLIIGALPGERGVVSTCSYEARKFGVHSAMSITEAYRRCPQGVYMHPNIKKYKEVSNQIRRIWSDYTDIVEYLSLDEGYLDVTSTAPPLGGAKKIGLAIKERTKIETGLTCSVGIGYSMMTAKLASEEKKPDGFFEIPDPAFFKSLILDRDVRVLYGVGNKTAEKLYNAGIHRVRDIFRAREKVISLLGSHGRQITELAEGRDNRQVTPYSENEAKSVGREHTFQHDISDFSLLKDALILIAKELSLKLRLDGIYCRTVTLKVKYGNMQSITRSKSGDAINQAGAIYKTAAALLDKVGKRPIRLIGISLSGLTHSDFRQLTLESMSGNRAENRKEELEKALLDIQRKYGGDSIKMGNELAAEKRFRENENMGS